VDGLVKAIAHVAEIDRADCRHAAETVFSQSAWGTVMESWFYRLMK
jgi:UDP-glucose:tetrahydrobiopterin glucosyltransferase